MLVRVCSANGPESKIGRVGRARWPEREREKETTKEENSVTQLRGNVSFTHSSLASAISLCYARRVCLKTCPIKMVQLYGERCGDESGGVKRFNKPITITIKFAQHCSTCTRKMAKEPLGRSEEIAERARERRSKVWPHIHCSANK